MTKEEYILEELDGVTPLCACGCGKETKYQGKKRGFLKYFDRSHYFKNKIDFEEKIIPCPTCGEEFKRTKNKKKYCSSKCAMNNPDLKKARKETLLKKYGVDNISKLPETREKAKSTMLERYGNEHPLKLEKFKEKRKKTNLEKYGTEYGIQSKIVRDKVKQTNLEKYGVENVLESEEVKDKIKQTNLDKYGVENPTQSKEVREKTKKTLKKKYGVENISQIESVKEKKKQKALEKYGVENVLQSEEIKDKIKQTNLEKYGVDNPSKADKVVQKRNRTFFNAHYDKIMESEAFQKKIEILFSKNEYNGIYDTYKFKCRKCDDVFESQLTKGNIPRCYSCYPSNHSSLAEYEIIEFIESFGLRVETNNRDILNGREIDILIPEKNIAIEFNGLYWHSEKNGKDKNYHKSKTLMCNEAGLFLIHIFEDEWNNSEDLVRNKLKYLLGFEDEKIYARKTEVREISFQDKQEFLDLYHIQGSDVSSKYMGLFSDDELVSVMTFSKKRIITNQAHEEGSWELSRFASSKQVVGGASKLFKYFIKHNNPKEVISYSDLRWTNPFKKSVYESMGFEEVSTSEPNYWYTNFNGISRMHRFSFRKSVLEKKLDIFDENLTEWENMQLNNYDRVWDCGNKKYSWKRLNIDN